MNKEQLSLSLEKDNGQSAENPIEPDAKHSKYIVYVDESGDHVLHGNDRQYPIFVLAFCIFHKTYYSEEVVPALEKFKFRHFGHDQVVLHEHEIRKEKGQFTNFANRAEKERFLEELTEIIEQCNFILVGCVVDKAKLVGQPDEGSDLYHRALAACMEALFHFLEEKGQHELNTHVVVECRGKREDRELELEFRRICDGRNRLARKLPFEVLFADKKVMSSGLQLADLVARPIGLNYLRPEQPNRAFDVLKEKFYCAGGRESLGVNYQDVGLKIIPPLKSERPR